MGHSGDVSMCVFLMISEPRVYLYLFAILIFFFNFIENGYSCPLPRFRLVAYFFANELLEFLKNFEY